MSPSTSPRTLPLLLIVASLTVSCTKLDLTAPTRAATPRTSAVAMSTASTNGQGPQACAPDTKLIGRFAASTAERPDTWWGLSKTRFDALGVTDYKAALEGFYGQSFATLDDAIQFLIDGVASFDTNGNGYVCAYEERGTRAHLGVNALYLLGVADDKHVGR